MSAAVGTTLRSERGAAEATCLGNVGKRSCGERAKVVSVSRPSSACHTRVWRFSCAMLRWFGCSRVSPRSLRRVGGWWSTDLGISGVIALRGRVDVA